MYEKLTKCPNFTRLLSENHRNTRNFIIFARKINRWWSLRSADDTYLVIPSANVDTRTQEIDNVAFWAAENNLKLNVSKTTEIVFQNSRRRRVVTPPSLLPGISRKNSLKILGVKITSHLSAYDHLRHVISESSQTLYALRVLRHHGMTEAGLHAVFHAVVVARLTYASPAWSGFITATDRQRVDAFLRRSRSEAKAGRLAEAK